MAEKSVNLIVAEALRYYMGSRWNHSSLARKAGVAPGTVKNCLFPDAREPSASGKEPSVKLTELAKIAAALGVTVADMVTDVTDDERAKIHRKRAAEFYAQHGELPSWAPEPESRKQPLAAA